MKVTAKEVKAKTKELKARLEKVEEELCDIMSEYSDLDYNLEVHYILEREHYQLTEFRLHKESQINDDED
jgi:hypothetical protein